MTVGNEFNLGLLIDSGSVLSGVHAGIRVGGVIVANVEFAESSEARQVGAERAPGIIAIDSAAARVVARVLETTQVVVLDIGAMRVARWRPPWGQEPSYTVGDTVELDVRLSLGSPEERWVVDADRRWNLIYRIKVSGLQCFGADDRDLIDIDETSAPALGDSEGCVLRGWIEA